MTVFSREELSVHWQDSCGCKATLEVDSLTLASSTLILQTKSIAGKHANMGESKNKWSSKELRQFRPRSATVSHPPCYTDVCFIALISHVEKYRIQPADGFSEEGTLNLTMCACESVQEHVCVVVHWIITSHKVWEGQIPFWITRSLGLDTQLPHVGYISTGWRGNGVLGNQIYTFLPQCCVSLRYYLLIWVLRNF